MVSLQVGASLATGLFGRVGASGATALRLGFASLILLAVFRPWRGGVPRRAWRELLLYGASLGCMNLLFYMSLRGVPLGVAVALEFVGPLAVTLRHVRHRIDLLWLVLAVFGLCWLLPVFHRPEAVHPIGAACALGAGVFWGAYMIVGPRAGAALGLRAVPLGTAIGALLVAPAGLLMAGPAVFSAPVLARGLVVALLSSAIPYMLEMVALTRLPTRVFGTLTAVEPAIAALAGRALLGQVLTLWQWAAIGAVMVAAAGAVMAEG